MVKKILLGFIFTLLFILFLLLTSVRFLFLNPAFLFASFSRHNVYQEVPRFSEIALNQPNLELEPEERLAYEAIAQQVTPELAQEVTEKNVLAVLNFLHGKSRNIEIFIPTSQLGIDTTDIYWSVDALQNPDLQKSLDLVYGLTNWLTIGLVILGLALLGLFVYLKSAGLVIIVGSLVLIIGLLLRVFIFALVQTLPQETEPAAILLALLGNSILADAAIIWIILGGLILTSGLIWKLGRKLRH